MRKAVFIELSLLAVFLLTATALPVFAKTDTSRALIIGVGGGAGFVVAAALASKLGEYAKMNARLKNQFTGLAVFFILFAVSQLLTALYYLDVVDYVFSQAADFLVLIGAVLTLAILWKK